MKHIVLFALSYAVGYTVTKKLVSKHFENKVTQKTEAEFDYLYELDLKALIDGPV